MGCVQTRYDITEDEEASSQNIDLYLGYSHVFLDKYLKVHNKNSDKFKVSDEQFNKIREKLGIKSKDPDCNQQISKLYSRFKVDSEFYSAKKLVNMAILLCRASDCEKSKSLFKNYLDEGQDKLYKEQVNEMFDDLLDVPIQILKSIQIEDEATKLSPAEIRAFVTILESGKSSTTNFLSDSIMMQDQDIDESCFVARLKKVCDKEFLCGKGLRKILKRHIKHS